MAKGNIGEEIKNILEKDFWDYIESKEGKEDRVEFYNEESLQFELGYYLRKRFSGYNIYIEFNTVKWLPKQDTAKHECDIILMNKNNENEKYAIELKFRRNKQYPASMFDFIQDILYMEQLKKGGFTDTYVLTLTDNDNKGFYAFSGRESKEKNRKEDSFSVVLYECFRGNKDINISSTLHGCYIGKNKLMSDIKYYKPTGDGKGIINYVINGDYQIIWHKKLNNYKILTKEGTKGNETVGYQNKDIYAYSFCISEHLSDK